MELHLFIIWENAAEKQDEILEDIGLNFEIVNVYQVIWSKKHFSRNISRFYGQKLPRVSEKQLHCGRGPFTLVIVRDISPIYGCRMTSRGRAIVNTRMFDAKERYRSWTGGGHKIHATNSKVETAHDLTLLLGITPQDYEGQNPISWTGEVHTVAKDLVGADGWESLSKLFYVLNQCINYVVLRNFEHLPDRHHVEMHGDIDLLTDDLSELTYIANAKKMSLWRQRVNYVVRIDGEECPFDFRHVYDGYYDAKWEQVILKSREFQVGGFFSPDPVNHFYSLLYHAVVHKPVIASDYVERLVAASRADGFPDLDKSFFEQKKVLTRIINEFFEKNGYEYVEPKDHSVYLSRDIVPNTSTLRAINDLSVLLLRPLWRMVKRLAGRNSVPA